MSRSGSVSALLGDPEIRVKAVAASGDCFYESIGPDYSQTGVLMTAQAWPCSPWGRGWGRRAKG